MARGEVREYSDRDCAQFVADMEELGLEPFHYRGRFYWEGPAVATDDDHDMQDIIRATTVRLQSDDLGRGRVVYPVSSDAGA